MAPKKVLVVDCDELVCWALEKEFSALRMKVRSVRSGGAALAVARELRWDLAFVEARLPDIEGIELLDRLRTILPDTHFFVFGCDPTPELRRRAFADGAEQVVDKPFDLVDVVNAARSSLGGFPVSRRFTRYLCRVPLRIAVEPLSSGEP
ncbi:MAG: response regulator, partial [bacterium]|nr:response regulator [bacterium]